jgi:uncharacterized protein YqgV (UPF0045/DUF77 family)
MPYILLGMGILLSRRDKVAEIEKKLFEMFERIEKMVKERKRVAMVVRADEIRGKEKRIEVLIKEVNGQFETGVTVF